MSGNPTERVLEILRSLAAGTIDARDAAAQFHALGLPGLAGDGALFSPAERDMLDRLMPAVRWEMWKLSNADLPDVTYDSPEYHAFIASIPWARVSDGPSAPSN
jgi:hypothetical protein